MKRINSFLLILILAIYSSSFTAVYAQSASAQSTDSSAAASAQTAPKTNPSLSITLPLKKDSVKFLAIGDTGRGNKEQNELAQVMYKYRQAFPYEFVIMTGDNIY